MKRSILFALVLVILSLPCSAGARQILGFSCSAQIAEAFGKEVITEFENKHHIAVDLYIGSSEVALQRLENGFSDLACVAFRLPNEYREKGYVEIPFARDPLAVVVNVKNPVNNLSLAELKAVFTKNVQDWAVLGGSKMQIVTVIPDVKTAAYVNFSRQAMQGFDFNYDFLARISTDVIEAVQYIPGSVSFISQGAAFKHRELKALTINKLDTRDPNYPLVQTFSFVTKGKPVRNAQEFINAAFSKRGREIIKTKCMCPLLGQ